jgi:hypothetical protein
LTLDIPAQRVVVRSACPRESKAEDDDEDENDDDSINENKILVSIHVTG